MFAGSTWQKTQNSDCHAQCVTLESPAYSSLTAVMHLLLQKTCNHQTAIINHRIYCPTVPLRCCSLSLRFDWWIPSQLQVQLRQSRPFKAVLWRAVGEWTTGPAVCVTVSGAERLPVNQSGQTAAGQTPPAWIIGLVLSAGTWTLLI